MSDGLMNVYRCTRCGARFKCSPDDLAIIGEKCGTCFMFLEFGVEDTRISDPPNVNDLATYSRNANPGNDATLKEDQGTLTPSDDVQK